MTTTIDPGPPGSRRLTGPGRLGPLDLPEAHAVLGVLEDCDGRSAELEKEKARARDVVS